MSDRIVQENARLEGRTERSYWDAAISNQIEGFTTDFSINAGQTVNFKINVNGQADDALPYKIEIFRLGYYGGSGAREIGEIYNADGTVQAEALFDESLGLVDAGNWTVTDSWDVPADAVSGVYLARVQRLDENGNPIDGATNQIPFIVRNDGVAADVVLQTSDTTWHAYNGWAGNNGKVGPNFYGDPAGMVDHEPVPDPGLGAQDRAYAVSYNRPFLTRDGGGAAAGAQDYLFGADYAAVSWLEKNGYDVSYISGVDTDRLGAEYLENYKAYISVGHDEYWSGDQRANVEAARDAGVNVLFWSGNEVYWKTRWEDAISADGTAYRTLVCYKETWANRDPNAGPEDYANIDPTNIWTGTWRDVRFLAAKDADGNYIAGGADPDPISGLYPNCHCAETTLTGQLFGPDGTGQFGGALDVPANYGALRVWRNTSATTGEQDISPGILGYEWDVTPDDANRPAGLIKLSESTIDWNGILVDQGNQVEPGTATHNLTLYRAPSGALVFASGTVFWSWGLSDEHDSSPYGANIENATLKQFAVNLFADMGIQPASLEQGLVAAAKSTDTTPASIAINDVADEVAARSSVTITGTATDIDGNAATTDGSVALIELSFDGGATWKAASGTTNWSYVWRPAAEGAYTIKARAIDDSLNVYNATPDEETVTVAAAVTPNVVSLFEAQPVNASSYADGQPAELGMRFSMDRAGDVTQLRYYRNASDSNDTDVRDGHLWRASDGALLATVTFTSAPGAAGWQFASLATPVALTPGEEYITSYRTADNYVSTGGFFASANETAFDGLDNDAFTDPYGVINAPEASIAKGNGVYRYGSDVVVPTETFGASNYWVDLTFDPADGNNNSPPVITSGDFAVAENQLTAGMVTAIDGDGNAIVYAITSGADAALFTINSSTGALAFRNAPNYEAPADAGADNVYNVTVSASDNVSEPVTKSIVVSVTDVQESGGTPDGSSLFDQAPTNFTSGTSDPTNYELGTKFVASQDGSITALRYYRGVVDADDTDSRTLRLWDASGGVLGSVAVTSTPSQTGWQVGSLTTSISITAGQTYIVSYGYVFDNGDGSVESYAATGNYFATSHTSPDGVLTAPASGAPSGSSSGGVGNGLYATGSPGVFPTQSFNAANYWVDVIFQGVGTGGGNASPAFTSPATLNALENQTAIGTVTASDPNGDPLTFSIVGGADADLFTIGVTNGRLELRNPQDFEGADNSFDVIVGVSDGVSAIATQAVTVNLTDVNEIANGPAALTGEVLRAEYIFGSTSDALFPGSGASQTATVGDGVEFVNLPSSGPDIGNGEFGLASVDAGAQTIRIEFPLDADTFAGQAFVRFAGPQDGKPFNGVRLSDAESLPTIRSVRIIGQEGFTTSAGEVQPLSDSDLTITADGIFLNVSDKGRLVDVDADTAGAQAAYAQLLVDLNDAPVLAHALADQAATAGTALALTVPADAFRDDDGDTLTYIATKADGSALPEWLSFDGTTHSFSGTPGNGDAGTLSVTVIASDGATDASASGSFEIAVAPSNRVPTGIVLSASTVSENSPGAVIGTLTTQDPDSGDSFLYDLSDGRFEVVTAQGVALLKLKAGVGLDHETTKAVTLNVTSTDSGDLSAQQIFTIAVSNVVENQTVQLTTNEFTAPSDDNWTVTGTTGGDSITTRGGKDIISGKGGSDTISTGGGDDVVIITNSPAGYNAIDGGEGSDTVKAAARDTVIGLRSIAGVETISSSGFTGVKLAGSTVSDTLDFTYVQLTGITRISGGAGNDVITGSAAADTIAGDAGDDTLGGGGGADTFLVGTNAGVDSYDGGGDNDRIVATVKNVVIGLSSLSNIESISSGGFSGVRIAGSAAGDVLDFTSIQLTGIGKISGGAGDDVITGSAVADTVAGDAGNDVLRGGGGADVFLVGSGGGFDTYDGGADSDIISATAKNVVIGLTGLSGIEGISSGGYSGVKVAGSVAEDTLDFTDVQLIGIGSISGGAGDDAIRGSSAADVIVGDAGTDTLIGNAGADRFVYFKTSESSVGAGDILQDFLTNVDKVDLKNIDAKTTASGNNTFSFVGDQTANSSFISRAGQLWTATGNDGVTHIFGDVDGRNGADLEIILGSQQTLSATDFFL